MYFTDRGIEELESRRGEETVSVAWLAARLQEFVDDHPDFEVPVDGQESPWQRAAFRALESEFPPRIDGALHVTINHRSRRELEARGLRVRRTDVGGARSGAVYGSSRAAYSMTSPGTRNPRVSCSTCASGLPRWPSASAHERVAHGVVAWARSPSTVSDPVDGKFRIIATRNGGRSWTARGRMSRRSLARCRGALAPAGVTCC